ncbi:MAG: hypothetical protein R6W76_20880, partial [Caldilinea sp.]
MNKPTTTMKRLTGALAVTLSLMVLLLVALPASAQESLPLMPGFLASGRITSALGEEWEFYACAGDEVTVTVTSTAFTPYLSVFTDTTEAPLIEAESEDGEAAQALLIVEDDGVYAVLAAGERRSDRGAYSITVDFAGAPDLSPDNVEGFLRYGAAITGIVQSSAGQVWALRGCAGDVMTVTALSEQFTPYVELYDPVAQETLSESVSLDDSQAIIDAQHAKGLEQVQRALAAFKAADEQDVERAVAVT